MIGRKGCFPWHGLFLAPLPPAPLLPAPLFRAPLFRAPLFRAPLFRPLLVALLLLASLGLGGCGAPAVTELAIASAPEARLPALEASLREQHAEDPDDAETAYLLSQVLLRRGDVQAAEEFALQATAVDPFHGRYTAVLGAIYLAQGKRFRALTALNQAIRADPDLLSTYIVLARTQTLLGDRPAAAETLKAALLREPRYFPALYALARLRYDAAAFSEAEAAITRARDVRPTDASARLLHVRIAAAQGRSALAETLIDGGLTAGDPPRPLLREQLDLFVGREDWARAEETMSRIHAQGEPTLDDLLAEARLLQGTGRMAQADALLARTVREYPDAVEAVEAEAAAAIRRGQAEQALARLRRVEETTALSSTGRYWVAAALYRLGRMDEGDRALEAALRDHPGDYRLRLLQARRRLQQRRLTMARDWAQEALQNRPKDEDLLLLQADLAMLSGDPSAAAGWLEQLEVRRSQPLVRFAWGRLNYLAGRYEDALRDSSALAREPTPAWRWVYLHAATLGRLGRPGEGIAALQPFQEHPVGRATVLHLLGQLQLQHGDRAAAERLFAKGLADAPRDADLLEGLTRIMLQAGRWKDAQTWLEPAVEAASPYRLLFLERLRWVYLQQQNAAGVRRMEALARQETDALLREAAGTGRDRSELMPVVGVSLLTSLRLLNE